MSSATTTTTTTATPLPVANVYIDGFNLYHGCFDDRRNERKRLRWRKWRWLDIRAMATNLFPEYTINRVRYFTAYVDPTPANPHNRARQLVYLRALQTLPNLCIHRGRFATFPKNKPLTDPSANPPAPYWPMRWANVIEREEKGSDVNLASYLLLDGFKPEYEVAVVVTNDSDLAEPIRLVRSELGLKVAIVNPHLGIARDLKNIADVYKDIREPLLKNAQLPPTLTDNNGTITKPAAW